MQAKWCHTDFVVVVLPIFLYGPEIWCLTSTLKKKIDALDNWCLRRILHIHWTDFVSNDVVRSRTGQLLLSDTIHQRRFLLWSSVPCRHRSRPLPSSPRLHSGSSQRLATKNWKTKANLAENSWGWSAPAQLRPCEWRRQDGALWIDRHGVYSWMRLRPRDILQRDRET